MLTRSKSRQERGVVKKFGLLAFLSPPTSGIFNIETIDGTKKQLPGSTVKVMVNGELKKGTIVSTSENHDDLLVTLEKLDVAAFFGIKKRKVDCKNSKHEMSSTFKRQKIEDGKLNPNVPKKHSRIPVLVQGPKFDKPMLKNTPTSDESHEFQESLDLTQNSPVPIPHTEANVPSPHVDIVQSPLSYTRFVEDRAVISHKHAFGVSPIFNPDAELQSLDKTSDLNRAFNFSFGSASTFGFRLDNGMNVEKRLEDIRPNSTTDYYEYISLESPNQDAPHSYADEGPLEMSLELSPLLISKNTTATEAKVSISPVGSSRYITPDRPIPFVPPIAPVKNSPRVHNYLPFTYSSSHPNDVQTASVRRYPHFNLYNVNQVNEVPYSGFSSQHFTPSFTDIGNINRFQVLPSHEPVFSNRQSGFCDNSTCALNQHQFFPNMETNYLVQHDRISYSRSSMSTDTTHPAQHNKMPFPRPTISADTVSHVQYDRTTHPRSSIPTDATTYPVSDDVVYEESTSLRSAKFNDVGKSVVGTHQYFSHAKLLQLRPCHITGQKLKPDYLLQCIDRLPKDESKNESSFPKQELILDALNSSKNLPEVFARELMARMFTLEEIRNRNVYGIARRKRPIGALDQCKVEVIKSLVEHYFPSSYFAWKLCVVKMNESIGNTFKRLARCNWLKLD